MNKTNKTIEITMNIDDKKHKQMQKEFDEDWNKWGHERKRKPKLLKEV